MNITILTDNPNSWIMPYVDNLKTQLAGHNIVHIFDYKDIVDGGDVLLILSCEKILPSEYLKFHKNNVVVHPSKLPHGKGWSPLAWQILEGTNKIPFSLFEAESDVDSGNVYLLEYLELNGTELNEEIKHKQGTLTMKMVNNYIENYDTIKGTPQIGNEFFYPKRRSKDSELDIDKTIRDQFSLLRIVDNERYPAHFYVNGIKYVLKIYKENECVNSQ